MLSEKIRHLRKKQGLSQQKLSHKTGLSVTAIANLEQGIAQQPTIQTIIKIADALDVSIDALVGREYKLKKKK